MNNSDDSYITEKGTYSWGAGVIEMRICLQVWEAYVIGKYEIEENTALPAGLGLGLESRNTLGTFDLENL